MPVMRVLLAACCLLLSASALAASTAPLGRGPGSRAPGGGGGTCPAFPAQCQINAPTFNFGRQQMNSTAPPIYGNAMISVTCTRHPQDRLEVQVEFELKGVVVQQPPRQMRDQIGGAFLAYDMYVDAARTRLWGDGLVAGTDFFTGGCILDERNRVCTIPFVLYGKVNGQQAVVPPGPYLGAVPARLEFRFLGCVP